ncbi:hypothetical protein [uncultured Roseibium sp.]|uniref:hypothetical protein n=1 Tax=uncultured Roseibium sp. TaxID=1936171 RepID=UPI00260C08AE|nr:hypothetical protein [uncultured Roseibium sp.]
MRSGINNLGRGYRADTVLADYARALALTGREDEAAVILERITSEWSRNQVLTTLAAQQPGKGDGQSKNTLLDKSIGPERRVVEYAMMSEAAFRRYKADEALVFLDLAREAATDIEAGTKAPHGHYRLASALDLAGDHEAAKTAARAIADPSNRAITLIELATRRAQGGHKNEAHALLAEAAVLREELPPEKRYLPLSCAAEFRIRQGETERALELARTTASDEERKHILGGLVHTAARSGHWTLAKDLAEEANAQDTLASVYGYCASGFAARGETGTNTCLAEAQALLDDLIRNAGERTERERCMLNDAIVAVAVAESLSRNPDAVGKLISALPDARSRQHANHTSINAQTGRDTTLALLMALNMERLDAKLEALARIARFLAAEAKN